MSDPIRFDPQASFDAEVARIGGEHGADVTFQLVEKGPEPVADGTCDIGCGQPVYRTYGEARAPGHEPMKDVALCEEHDHIINGHQREAYKASPGTQEAKDKHRHLAENPQSELKYPRRPRARDDGSIGLERSLTRDTETRRPPSDGSRGF